PAPEGMYDGGNVSRQRIEATLEKLLGSSRSPITAVAANGASITLAIDPRGGYLMDRVAGNGDRQVVDFSYAMGNGALTGFASEGRAYVGTAFSFSGSPVPLNRFAGAWTNGDHFIRLLPTTYQGNS